MLNKEFLSFLALSKCNVVLDIAWIWILFCFRNKAGYLDSELNTFIHQYLKPDSRIWNHLHNQDLEADKDFNFHWYFLISLSIQKKVQFSHDLQFMHNNEATETTVWVDKLACTCSSIFHILLLLAKSDDITDLVVVCQLFKDYVFKHKIQKFS